MAPISVTFYQESENSSEVITWLRDLRKMDPKAFAKFRGRIARLAEMGHELRRPEADFLRDGIHELRQKRGSINYRLLYFFNGQTIAVIAGGLTKEKEVPNTEIDKAISKKVAFANNPGAHSFRAPL